ncbi:GPO family capsid scaffolding protein [Paraburkholderia phenazinium]|uniref:GPO family capsid scaffolding protein n=1 Tax=Paraburkholderia phenazinium TaxID=60549 RepID=UPI00158C8930|nr:GPO family capsid scaffolding protein [Paraburkholderia phenazinium]
MAKQSKFFRVATEGATTDGRTISRDWITQMAANYNPKLYAARVNMEHIRGFTADGPFRMYGDVLALEARGVEDGKLGLFAQIEPTDDLVAMTKARQKIYTSIEVSPSFADTKQAYCVGVAVTDSPASLGTDVLSFAAQNPNANPFASRKQAADNLFTAAIEASIEFDTTIDGGSSASLFSMVKGVLAGMKRKSDTDESRFADVTQAVEALATHGAQQAHEFAALVPRVDAGEQAVAQLSERLDASEKAFADLTMKLSMTCNGQPSRPPATGSAGTGGTADVTTDC